MSVLLVSCSYTWASSSWESKEPRATMITLEAFYSMPTVTLASSDVTWWTHRSHMITLTWHTALAGIKTPKAILEQFKGWSSPDSGYVPRIHNIITHSHPRSRKDSTWSINYFPFCFIFDVLMLSWASFIMFAAQQPCSGIKKMLFLFAKHNYQIQWWQDRRST